MIPNCTVQRVLDAHVQYVETTQKLELIASAIVKTLNGRYILGHMKADAPNRLKGQWHFPGTGIAEPLSEVPVALSAYLHGALGVPITVQDRLFAWVRTVEEEPGNPGRDVFHVYYRGHFDGNVGEARRAIRAGRDLAKLAVVTKSRALALLSEGEVALDRLHGELFQHL